MQSNVITVDFRRKERATPIPRLRGLGEIMLINFGLACLMLGVVWWFAWWWR
jgi:hypothetical protein